MTLVHTKRLLIALLAQVTLCLSLAPVLAAQVPTQKKDSKGTESPTGDGLTILAARDAANGRPEDVTETERSQVRRVGRVSTRRFGRGETRRVETRPTASYARSDFSPSTGTPAEDWGGGSAQVVGCASAHVHGRSDPAIPRVLKHTLREASLPNRFDAATALLQLTQTQTPHQLSPSLFLCDCIQPTGPPEK